MIHKFKARIHVVGINPCVNVPAKITATMTPRKGYIAIKGKIEGHPFVQTLVPVKGKPYRLFVNGPMLKGAGVKAGDTATFEIGEDKTQRSRSTLPMPGYLKSQLEANDLFTRFEQFTPTRKKMIIHYLSHLKQQASAERAVDKLIKAMKENDQTWWMTRP